MNHERFEELLPAYLEGDLDAATRAQVEAALAASAELRSSLEAFRSLEDSLVMRREQVPPASQFLDWLAQRSVARALARAHARSPVHRFFDGLLSWPSLATIGFIVVGMWTYWHRSSIATFFIEGKVNATGVESRFASMIQNLNGLLTTLSGGDMMIMAGIYGMVTLAILAFTGAMTMRFVRHD